MNLSQIKKHRSKTKLLPIMLTGIPLITPSIDLPFAVAASTSVKNSVAFALEMLFIHFFTMIVGWVVRKKLKIWQRFIVTTITSTLLMIISRALVLSFFPDIENSAGMYLYLMAMNGVTLAQAGFLDDDATLKAVVESALINISIFSSVVFLVSAIREYLANSTFWGVPIPFLIKLDGARSPFFGFILLGILLGIWRFVSRQIVGFQIIDSARKEKIALASQKEVR